MTIASARIYHETLKANELRKKWSIYLMGVYRNEEKTLIDVAVYFNMFMR